MKGKCSIEGCISNAETSDVQFFQIRPEWCEVIPEAILTNKRGQICSLHFDETQVTEDFKYVIEGKNKEIRRKVKIVTLKNNAYPLLFDISAIPSTASDVTKEKNVTENAKRTSKRSKSSLSIKEEVSTEGLPADSSCDDTVGKKKKVVRSNNSNRKENVNASKTKSESDNPRRSKRRELNDSLKEKNNSNVRSPITKKRKPQSLRICIKQEKPFPCKECLEKFSSILKLRSHVKKLHNDVKYACSFCTRMFPSKRSLQCHENIHNGKEYKCEICDRGFGSSSHLSRHQLTHNPIYRYTCHVCIKGFTAKHAFYYHMMWKHTDHWFCKKDGNEYCCIFCPEMATRKTALESHFISRHRYDILDICRFCETYFTTKELLAEHVAEKHDEREEKEIISRLFEPPRQDFTCHICGKTFVNTTRWNFKAHLKTHDDNRPFRCDICKSAFKFKTLLRVHIDMVHLKTEKPYTKICKVCKKAFYNASSLKQHMRTHSDVRAFECHICSATFRTPQTLRHHKLCHIPKSERPHKCTHCSKAFNIPSLLKAHLRTHSGTKPFPCDVCNLSFRDKRQMQQHKAKVHCITD